MEFLKAPQASDLWQQVELASELEADQQDTVDCSMKWLVDFNAAKTQFVSTGQSNNSGAIAWVGYCKKVIFQEAGTVFLFYWIGSLALSLLLQLSLIILDPWFTLWSFFPTVALYLCKSILRLWMEYCWILYS